MNASGKGDETLFLESLQGGGYGISKLAGGFLAEAAAVCLDTRNHQSQTRLQIFGLLTETRLLDWKSPDAISRRTHADPQYATEHGAYGIAILLTHEYTGKIVVEQSVKGTGFDYWMGHASDTDDLEPFSNIARLEVSGILSGTEKQVETRVKQKKVQMRPTNHVTAGMVAIVEFSAPLACLDQT